MMKVIERQEAFRNALVELVNAQIKSVEIAPEEATAVLAEEAKTTLDHLEWKSHPQRAVSEHLVAAAAYLNDGRVIPVLGFDILFPCNDAGSERGMGPRFDHLV